MANDRDLAEPISPPDRPAETSLNIMTVASNQAARRLFDGSNGASVSRSLNGRRSRLSVSCVGLWRGLIARSTFGLAIRTFAANSFTPIARITLPSAS